MFINRNITFGLFLCLFGLLITSCSPSTTTKRSSKYSSAEKREKSAKQKTSEDKKYVYHTKSASTVKKSESNLMTRDEIVLSAMKYTGRDYKPGGKTPETGFDCSGFTSYVFNLNGIPISGSSDQQAKLGKQKSKNNLLPGDLVFFGNEDRISHVAIVASNKPDELEIVHSTTSAGVKIDNISNSEYWNSRFLFGVDVISK
ncbi:MAG TPA: C40 family peptidase [Saprospiraceae bacterium]|nr:C40 family peptidase [Saprospiraceae bacterium]